MGLKSIQIISTNTIFFSLKFSYQLILTSITLKIIFVKNHINKFNTKLTQTSILRKNNRSSR